MKKILLITLMSLLLLVNNFCANRKVRTEINKENEKLKTSIDKKKESSKEAFNSENTSKELDFSKNTKEKEDLSLIDSSKVYNTHQESQNDTRFSISLKNNGDILNQNYLGNFVFQNGPNNSVLIPISSGTELKIEDSKSLKNKFEALELKYRKIINIAKEKDLKIDSLSKEKQINESLLKEAKAEALKNNFLYENEKKNKLKNSESKSLGFWGYFWLILCTAIISILLLEYLKKKIL